MKLFHTLVMNYQRVTVSLPKNVYQDLITLIGKGKVSNFVANATKRMVLDEKLSTISPVDAFLAHRDKLPKLNDKQITAAIRKGRM